MIYSSGKIVNYLIHILKSSSTGQFEITDQGFVQIPDLNTADLKVIGTNDSPFIKDILVSLRQQYGKQMSDHPTLKKLEVAEPHFVLTFENPTGSSIKMTGLYNIVQNEVSVLSVEQ